jgi:hypothetical protein
MNLNPCTAGNFFSWKYFVKNLGTHTKCLAQVSSPNLNKYMGQSIGPSNFLKKLRIRDKRGFKGIFQPFELGAETSLIRSAVKFFKAGHLNKFFLMIQSHERSLKPISAA